MHPQKIYIYIWILYKHNLSKHHHVCREWNHDQGDHEKFMKGAWKVLIMCFNIFDEMSKKCIKPLLVRPLLLVLESTNHHQWNLEIISNLWLPNVFKERVYLSLWTYQGRLGRLCFKPNLRNSAYGGLISASLWTTCLVIFGSSRLLPGKDKWWYIDDGNKQEVESLKFTGKKTIQDFKVYAEKWHGIPLHSKPHISQLRSLAAWRQGNPPCYGSCSAWMLPLWRHGQARVHEVLKPFIPLKTMWN